MKKYNKLMAIGSVLLVSLITSIIFVMSNLYDYLIVAFPLTIILGIWFIYEIINRNISNEDTYNKALSKITRVYDPILVNTNTFPKLNNKSILNVNNFNDLVDAQAETRKPIYFVIGKDSTAFYLVNDDLFLVYFLKIDNNSESDLEIELKKVELQSSLNLDAIKDFDKTVVIQTNNKSYKVSPIREKKEETKDENKIATKIEECIPKKKKEIIKKEYLDLINFYKTLINQNTDFSNLTSKQKAKFESLLDNIEKSEIDINEEEQQEIDKIKQKLMLEINGKDIKLENDNIERLEL